MKTNSAISEKLPRRSFSSIGCFQFYHKDAGMTSSLLFPSRYSFSVDCLKKASTRRIQYSLGNRKIQFPTWRRDKDGETSRRRFSMQHHKPYFLKSQLRVFLYTKQYQVSGVSNFRNFTRRLVVKTCISGEDILHI